MSGPVPVWNPMAQQYEPKPALTLADFLLARIAEDEAAARGFDGTAYARWRFEPDPDPGRIGGRVAAGSNATVANDWSSPHNPAGYIGVSPHIARWDPARVLAECETKRWLVETFRPIDYVNYNDPEILRRLALPYADHPDYDEAWKP